MADQNFDDIAHKFHKNIYGTTKGKLRHELLCHHLSRYLPSQPQTILDAGGGTGVMTAHLASLGHQVTLLDVSKESIGVARQHISEPSVTYQHGEIHEVQKQFDVVVCHAVLEWLVDPHSAIIHLFDRVEDGGILSLSFFNKDAAVYSNLLYGNFDYVRSGLKRKNTVRLNPNYPLSPQTVIDWVSALPGQLEHVAGIRCIHDYMQKDHAKITYEELVEMELQYGVIEPYQWLGKYFHIIIRKNRG